MKVEYGIKDLIRLHAFGLVEHPYVVVLDVDTLVMQPLDPVFAMLDQAGPGHQIAYPKTYSPAGELATGFNSGVDTSLIIFKPSLETFNDIVNAYKNTTYDPLLGWDSSGVHGFPGSMHTSGILAHYYGPHRLSQIEASGSSTIPEPIILDECIVSFSIHLFMPCDPNLVLACSFDIANIIFTLPTLWNYHT